MDPAWLARWLAARVEVTPPLTLVPIAGGRSNLTYLVHDVAGHTWVLRRPPEHSVHPTAHDVGRELRVLNALAETTVPVPSCLDLDVLPDATPFYVMDFVQGVVLRTAADVDEHLPRDARVGAVDDLIAVLVDLHTTEADAIGLGDLGRGAGYAQRQLRRWQEQADAMRDQKHRLSDEVHAELSARLPEHGDTVIVHGDYRLDNAIVEPTTGRVRAIVDWELCTLGDPLVDLAVALSYWTLPNDHVRPLGDAPTLAGGFPTRAQVLERYEAHRGQDLPNMALHMAFAQWRLGIVLEGVYARFTRGGYARDVVPDDLDSYPEIADQLVRESAELLG